MSHPPLPLTQRIRRSLPVRLLLDNRLVRHFADKPVTAAPTRAQTILIGLVPALVIMALLVTAWFLVALAPGTFGGPLVLLTLPILFFGGLLIGRTGGTAIITVIATGLFLVTVLTGSVRIVGDLILDTRGEEVTAHD